MKKTNLFLFSLMLVFGLGFSLAVIQAQEESITSNEAVNAEVGIMPITTQAPLTTSTQAQTKTQVNRPAQTINFNGKTLERIPSPAEIKNFQVMKNENGTLYGTRIQAQDQTNNSNQSQNANDKAKVNANQNSALNTSSQALEKIPSPAEIKNFRVMKNENGTLYGIRIQNKEQVQEEKKEQVQERAQNRVVGADIRACVFSAIDKKDDALKTRLSTLNQEISALIENRNACQKVAIESELSQEENLKKCNQDFEAKHKNLMTLGRDNQGKIWGAYQEDMKACLPSKEREEGKTLIIQDGGSGSLENSISL